MAASVLWMVLTYLFMFPRLGVLLSIIGKECSYKTSWLYVQWICSSSTSSEKINFSYYILLHLITSYSSYFRGKKGISGNKTSFFLLMMLAGWEGSASDSCVFEDALWKGFTISKDCYYLANVGYPNYDLVTNGNHAN